MKSLQIICLWFGLVLIGFALEKLFIGLQRGKLKDGDIAVQWVAGVTCICLSVALSIR